MPYTIKSQQIAVKDPDTGEYVGVDLLTEQTTEGLLNEIETLGNQKKNEITQLGDSKKQAITDEATLQTNAITQLGNSKKQAITDEATLQTNAITQLGNSKKQAITDEATLQIRAVETKGQEVLASIPSDYTELADTVNSMVNGSYIYDTKTGTIASFDDGADNMLIKSLVVDIKPTQESNGHITGWIGATVSHSGADTSDPETISVNWQSEAGTVYGGTIDIVSGKLRVTNVKLVYDGSDDEDWLRYISPKHRFFYISEASIVPNTSTYLPYISNKLNNKYIVLDTGELGFYFTESNRSLRVRYADDNNLTVDDLRAWLAAEPLEIVAELIEPIPYQLTPQEVECLTGVNNIWADTGDVTVTYPVDTKTYIDKKIQEAIDGLSGS